MGPLGPTVAGTFQKTTFLQADFVKLLKPAEVIIKIHFIILITSARRLCNHLGLYVCMCVFTSARLCNHLGLYVCMCVCVFVCEHDNSRNTKLIHTKFFECISHRLRKS